MRISDWSSDVCSSDLHVIVAEGLHDRQYVEARTEGFAELKAHLAEYPPEKMAEICGIPAETIREVARLYAKAERAIIFWGRWEEGRVGHEWFGTFRSRGSPVHSQKQKTRTRNS